MKRCKPTPAHEAFLADLKVAISKHEHLSAPELLAIAAQFVGSLIALQDQAITSPKIVMEMVARNIEMGNQAAIVAVLGNVQGNA